jgi:hypothetical protein
MYTCTCIYVYTVHKDILCFFLINEHWNYKYHIVGSGCESSNFVAQLKVCDPIDSLIPPPSKLRFWYQKKAPIFLITPVNFKAREMFHLDAMNKNVRKCGNQIWFNTLFYGAYLCTFLLLLSKPLYQVAQNL